MTLLIAGVAIVGIGLLALAAIAPGAARDSPALRAQQASLGVFFLCEAATRGNVLPRVFGALGVAALLATLVASTIWAIRTGGT